MKKIVLLLAFVIGGVSAVEIEHTRPNIVIADKDGAPIDGVAGSVTELNASEKILRLKQDGEFLMIRPPIKVTVSGNEVTVDPEPGDGVGVVDPPSEPSEPSANVIQCPDRPTSVTASRTWTLCDVKSADKPEYTANGSDYLVSYRIPSTVATDNKAQLYVFMHPSTSGDQFVSGSSSFDYSSAASKNQIEIHPLEQTVGKNPEGVENSGGWWGYSGYDKGAVGNYNGKSIAASVCYVATKHSDIVDIAKGLKLAGTSLGGAGSYIQSQLLPELIYQECGINIEISSVHSNWGIMNMTEASEIKAKSGWGAKAESPDLYDSTDLRLNWAKVQNAHFYWGGGQNDGLGRMSTDWMDTCELRKISCSLRWLQSGHGPNETGYTLPSGAWVDSKHYVTADVILPVITNNTANHRGELRGYINRGISWDYANIVDTVDEIKVPLKYVAMKNVGPELPDQPDTMTFSVTFRHVKNFDTSVVREVDWTFGSQSGTAVVGGDGLLTIDNLELPSADTYTVISVKKHDGGGVVTPPSASNSFDFDIVYSRVPRSTGLREGVYLDGTTFTSAGWDWRDKLPEAERPFHSFNAPGQLIHRKKDGSETIIYDCMDSERPCVPLDPMISLDGTKVAFAVMSANSLVHTHPANRKYPIMVLGDTGRRSHIVIHDFATEKQTEWPILEGVNDSAPVWLPDGRMMFTSTRGKFTVPYMHRITRSSAPQPRLYTANESGSDVQDISPHELTAALHPYVHSSGRVFYSTKWLSHNLAYGTTNSGINWPGTTGNMWAVAHIDHTGGDYVASIGAHKAGINIDTTVTRNRGLIVPHFLGERRNGDMCAANYYRANNLGGGNTFCFPPPIYPLEGPPPKFSPEGGYYLTKWGLPQDNASRQDDEGIYQGKTGYPEGIPNSDQMLITHFDGLCTQVVDGEIMERLEATGNIGCNAGIKMTSVIPSQHPDDLISVVNHPDWHEFGARIVTPKRVALPSIRENLDDTCTLASSDAGTTDSYHAGEYNFNSEYKHVDNNGALMEGIAKAKIDDVRYESGISAIRFYKLLPNFGKTRDWKNHIGNKVELLGDAPLLPDGSFKVELLCDTAFTMAGLDDDGRVIMRDQIPQSLRPGEARVCTGCHLHSVEGKPYENSLAYNAPALPILEATAVPTFTNDILPMFEQECGSCHTPEDSPFFDYDKLVLDYSQKYVLNGKRVQMLDSTSEVRKYGLQKPMSSKYVSTMYARESLLYWKAANKRTDGRADDTYDNDIDFGADHPTTLTSIELKMIGDWLDSGAAK